MPFSKKTQTILECEKFLKNCFPKLIRKRTATLSGKLARSIIREFTEERLHLTQNTSNTSKTCTLILFLTGFFGGSVVKNPCADAGDAGLIPG